MAKRTKSKGNQRGRYPLNRKSKGTLPFESGWIKGSVLFNARRRVFVACWGHTYRDFDVAPAREIVTRGILRAIKVLAG